MSGEIQANYATGRTVYCLIRNTAGQIWNGSAFVSYNSANYALYVVSLTEQSASGYYVGNFPSAIAAGSYNVVAKNQVGGSPAETDGTIAQGSIEWNGGAVAALSDTATSGQLGQIAPIRVARGVAISGFMFKLVSAADHVTPFTSGVVSGQISRDGGAFGALQSGTFSEVGLGFYRTNLTSGDLLATTIGMVFTAQGISGGSSDPYALAAILQRVSGQ